MRLDDLLDELGTLPTMMTADEELRVIRTLSEVPDEHLLEHLQSFFGLLGDLYDSHTGAAIFDVDDRNLPEFQEFAARLRGLALRAASDWDAERLRNAASAFSERFSL